MQSSQAAFEKLLYTQLIPEFCEDPVRGCHAAKFGRESIRVSERDAADFMRAWDAQLIHPLGRGIYRTARSAAGEQFFWTGPKSTGPRSFTLWLEPVITIAALARLHFDFGWPDHLIGTQSRDWAFDIVAFLPDSDDEFIAGEVKKSWSEIEQLLSFMKEFGSDPSLGCPPSGRARNAFKKVVALRTRRAPVFWAIGPDGQNKLHTVLYRDGDVVELIAADSTILVFERR